MGHKGEESTDESPENSESMQLPSAAEDKELIETDRSASSASGQTAHDEKASEPVMVEKDHRYPVTADGTDKVMTDGTNTVMADGKAESDAEQDPVQPSEPFVENTETKDSSSPPQQKGSSEIGSPVSLQPAEAKSVVDEEDQVDGSDVVPDQHKLNDLDESTDDQKTQEESSQKVSPVLAEASSDSQAAVLTEPSDIHHVSPEETESAREIYDNHLPDVVSLSKDAEVVTKSVSHDDASVKAVEGIQIVNDYEPDDKEQRLSSGTSVSDSAESLVELEKVKIEIKMMETALQGAARQAQVFSVL